MKFYNTEFALSREYYKQYLDNKKRIREIYANLKGGYNNQETYHSIKEAIDKMHGVNYSDNLFDGVIHSGGRIKREMNKTLVLPNKLKEEEGEEEDDE